jgi:large subunit ribosomal protein L7/L12
MASFDAIIDQLEKLTLPEVAELVKTLEEKWGVSAAAPMMVGAMPMGGAAAPAEAAAEQTEFEVVLADIGAEKIKVIKAVREVNPSLGLKEAKDVVEAAPSSIVTGVNKEEAERAKGILEEAGAKVTIK